MKTTEITLTVAEILDLARATGFCPKDKPVCEDSDLEVEFTIIEKEGGVEVHTGDEEDTPLATYAHVAYITEYPEEGTYPLGEPIQP